MIQSTMSRPKPGSRKPVFLSRNDCRATPVTYPFLQMAAARSGVSMRMNCASSATVPKALMGGGGCGSAAKAVAPAQTAPAAMTAKNCRQVFIMALLLQGQFPSNAEIIACREAFRK